MSPFSPRRSRSAPSPRARPRAARRHVRSRPAAAQTRTPSRAPAIPRRARRRRRRAADLARAGRRRLGLHAGPHHLRRHAAHRAAARQRHGTRSRRPAPADPHLPRPQQRREDRATPRELSLDGAPAGHDPAAGDIGYWAPDGHLVLYYDDAAPYWNGIVRIGELDGDMAAVKRLPEGARVTIEPTG